MTQTFATIPFFQHSSVDVITNSSSVVYVMALASAKDKMSKLVNALFGMAGSELKFDDVFNYTTYNGRLPDDHRWGPDSEDGDGLDETSREAMSFAEYVVYREANQDEYPLPDGGWDSYVNEFILVTVKEGVEDTANATVASEVLSNLQDMFDYEGSYDG